MPLLLDSTLLVDALRGRPVVERIRTAALAGDDLYTCAIVVDEVVRGVHPSEEAATDRLLRSLLLAPMGRLEGVRAGTWRRAYASRGVTLSQPDCLIAASAVGIGARLATANVKDFPMPELTVEHWPSG